MGAPIFAASPAEAYAAAHYGTREKRLAHAAGIDTCDGTYPLCRRQAETCPTCHGAGGWQQHDGLIIECPRGCMTGGAS